MKIGLLQNISNEHPQARILRISDFTSEELSFLRDQMVGMVQASGVSESELRDGGSGTRLQLGVGDVDRGVVLIDGTQNYRCTLTAESWRAAAGMLSSLLNTNLRGHQWLYDLPDAEIELLVSRDGRW